ncbi:MAG: hypothetical protein IJI41_11945 [Anaerolineaceae bacterium]|nr:hypothetical protein [Anaerolineaceae bacterium]
MSTQAFFSGLVYDENNNLLETTTIGNESFYIVDDCGFKRHIESREVDEKIFHLFTDQIDGNEEYLANAAANMTGKTDLFSMAMFKNQLLNIDKEIDTMLKQSPPPGLTEFLGMSGFKINIDLHGNIVQVNMPSISENQDE